MVTNIGRRGVVARFAIQFLFNHAASKREGIGYGAPTEPNLNIPTHFKWDFRPVVKWKGLFAVVSSLVVWDVCDCVVSSLSRVEAGGLESAFPVLAFCATGS